MSNKRRIKQKFYTVWTNPRGVITKYVRRFVYWVRGDLVPLIQSENYDFHWNYLSFSNKRILDLGADYGSTASFFLKKGAKQVIAVEGDENLVVKLTENYAGNPKVIPVKMMICSAKQICSLISSYSPDIVKMDIEGSECHLLECKDNFLMSVKEWLIETHSQELYRKLARKYISLGFRVFKVTYSGKSTIIATGS